MSKFDESMNEFFDLPIEETPNLPQTTEPKQIIPHETLDIDLKNDYEIARENFHELIDKGKDALDDLLAIARESEKGRDFEVVATLLSSLINSNKEMIEMHKKIREIANYKQNNSSDTKIQNALFVGSTTELSKMLKELNMKDI